MNRIVLLRAFQTQALNQIPDYWREQLESADLTVSVDATGSITVARDGHRLTLRSDRDIGRRQHLHIESDEQVEIIGALLAAQVLTPCAATLNDSPIMQFPPVARGVIAQKLNFYHEARGQGFYGQYVSGRFFRARLSKDCGLELCTAPDPEYGEWVAIPDDAIAFANGDGKRVPLPTFPAVAATAPRP